MTSQDYKATPELWAHMECCADNPQDIATLLLELRSRVEALEEAENDRRFEAAKALIDKPAPATLAQPEPVAPTDEDLLEEWYRLPGESKQDVVAFARAVLARWGTPTRQEDYE
jgi:hypothetical protein